LFLSVTILGSGSALPLPGRSPSSQLVSTDSAGYLIDCGEGTQYKLRTIRRGISKIRAICISHLHGDHYYGVFGLLDTMAMSGRTEPLYLIAPQGLKSILIEKGRVTQALPPPFPIHFVETQPTSESVLVYADKQITIESFSLDHGIHCTGFLIKTNQVPRSIHMERLGDDIPYEAIRMLKEGRNVFDKEGNLLYSVEEYTTSAPGEKSYAYCSDTGYLPSLSSSLKGVDLLYHEATFTEELVEKARQRGHSTARQAAMIARDSGVKRLLIGHLSSRYKEIQIVLEEARTVFPETEYAEEGKTFLV
jgi:ribonuclease Z